MVTDTPKSRPRASPDPPAHNPWEPPPPVSRPYLPLGSTEVESPPYTPPTSSPSVPGPVPSTGPSTSRTRLPCPPEWSVHVTSVPNLDLSFHWGRSISTGSISVGPFQPSYCSPSGPSSHPPVVNSIPYWGSSMTWEPQLPYRPVPSCPVLQWPGRLPRREGSTPRREVRQLETCAPGDRDVPRTDVPSVTRSGGKGVVGGRKRERTRGRSREGQGRERKRSRPNETSGSSEVGTTDPSPSSSGRIGGVNPNRTSPAVRRVVVPTPTTD